MKVIHLLVLVLLAGISTPSYAQSSKSAVKNMYFVMAPHTPEQCMNTMMDMKKKGDPYLSKFYFGCMSGDHTSYGFLEGTSEKDVRNMLPKAEREGARITKVDKFTVAQIEKMHKDHSAK